MDRLPIGLDALRAWFPARVAVAARLAEPGVVLALASEEEQALGWGVDAARREAFALGRAAAHDALSSLGINPSTVGRGPAGEPLWPSGVVGSISHAAGTALAVVARATSVAGLGVDLEQRRGPPTAAEVRAVCTTGEAAWLDAADTPEQRAGRYMALFAAKEAAYKAIFPTWRVLLSFREAELTWRPDLVAFEASIVAGGRRASLPIGCWTSTTAVLAATYLELPSPARPGRRQNATEA